MVGCRGALETGFEDHITVDKATLQHGYKLSKRTTARGLPPPPDVVFEDLSHLNARDNRRADPEAPARKPRAVDPAYLPRPGEITLKAWFLEEAMRVGLTLAGLQTRYYAGTHTSYPEVRRVNKRIAFVRVAP
jgi:hypothetical protein